MAIFQLAIYAYNSEISECEKALFIQSSSVATERPFSLLNASFSAQQSSSFRGLHRTSNHVTV